MQSGKLRFRVTLQRRTETQQPGGQPIQSYVDIATVKAAIRPLSGRELIAAQQVQFQANTEITIRWRGDIDETCRVRHVVVFDSPEVVDNYDVIAPLPDPKTNRRELKLLCVKRSAEGWQNA